MKWKILLGMAMGIVASATPIGAVHAGTVLYDNAGFIEGAQSFVQTMQIASPGTLTVTLEDVPWLDTIADLNCFITTATNVLGTPMGIGTNSVAVGAGTIYVHWFGDATGSYGLGAYTLNVTMDANGATAVGLPTTLILLLSGIGMLLGWQRRGPSPGRAPTHDEALTV